jgi:acyl carrier protein
VSPDDILAEIRAVARRHLDYAGPLEPEMHLVEDLELDSLRRLTLAVEVENHFRVCLDEEDDLSVETVGDLVRVVAAKLAAGEAGPSAGDAEPAPETDSATAPETGPGPDPS